MSRMSELAAEKAVIDRLTHYEHDRRTAAALNACKGISTEALEAGVVEKAISVATQMHVAGALDSVDRENAEFVAVSSGRLEVVEETSALALLETKP